MPDGTHYSLHEHDGKIYLKYNGFELMSTALTYSEQMLADVFISIGTSGMVYPAAGFAEEAKRHGAHLIEANLKGTDISPIFDEHIEGPATETIPELVEQLIQEI